jgi:hypothetical protein
MISPRWQFRLQLENRPHCPRWYARNPAFAGPDYTAKSKPETERSLLNSILRTGLDSLEKERAEKHNVITIEVKNLGRCKYPSLDDISEVHAVAEGENFK